MLRAVDNKWLFLDDNEHTYLLELKSAFGEDIFKGMFVSNKDGIIKSVTPPADRETPIVIIFFLLNIMMNQRLRNIDIGVNEIISLEKRISIIEEKLNEPIQRKS